MNAQSTFEILFWIKKNRIKNGKAPLVARITVAGSRAELSVHRDVSPLEWNSKGQMVFSKSQDAKDINNHLALFKTKLLNCYGKVKWTEKRKANIAFTPDTLLKY